MQIKLGGEADAEELCSELWQKWLKVLERPTARVYEFLVTQYSDGIEVISTEVIAKHCNVFKTQLTKPGGIFDQLEAKGLVDKAEVDE